MNIAQVVLDIDTRSLDRAFSYSVPPDLTGVVCGCSVLVPFGSRECVGYVISVANESVYNETCVHTESKAPYVNCNDLKPIIRVLSDSYFDESAAQLALIIAREYLAPISACIRLFTPKGRVPKIVSKQGRPTLIMPAVRRKRIYAHAEACSSCHESALLARSKEHFVLTDSQQRALAEGEKALASSSFAGVLFDGVTGSGKTEVYMRLIARCLEHNRTAVVLVPEISLTPQTAERFIARFGPSVAVMHSKMTATERYDQWCDIKAGKKHIVIGPRSALFAPLSDIGLVVIDEVHDDAYKQDSAPRYDARKVAQWITQLHGAALVMGSATPSIELLYEIQTDDAYTRVVLNERTNQSALPQIELVNMAQEFAHGHRHMFSSVLENALKDCIRSQKKAVLLLNHRGFAHFVLCRDCGFVPQCEECSVSLTYHDTSHELICHHCGKHYDCPIVCPRCGSIYLKKFGAGTQRVESELRALLRDEGHCKIIRMDADSTRKTSSHTKLLSAFAQPGPAVLLGTQMIAKGLDFSDVILVGVIDADTMLRLPDFRAQERSFSLIEQVAGRAGRKDHAGRVIVQSYHCDEPCIIGAAHYNRKYFLQNELPKRRMLRYPPYCRLVRVLVWGKQEEMVKTSVNSLADELRLRLDSHAGPSWELVGPAPCVLERVRMNYRWQILIKTPLDADIAFVLEDFFRTIKTVHGVFVACDIDPVSLF